MLDLSNSDNDDEDILDKLWKLKGFDVSTIEHFHLRFLFATNMDDFVAGVLREQRALGSKALNPFFKDG